MDIVDIVDTAGGSAVPVGCDGVWPAHVNNVRSDTMPATAANNAAKRTAQPDEPGESIAARKPTIAKTHEERVADAATLARRARRQASR